MRNSAAGCDDSKSLHTGSARWTSQQQVPTNIPLLTAADADGASRAAQRSATLPTFMVVVR